LIALEFCVSPYFNLYKKSFLSLNVVTQPLLVSRNPALAPTSNPALVPTSNPVLAPTSNPASAPKLQPTVFPVVSSSKPGALLFLAYQIDYL
jgi:hypothetical protein